MYHCKIAQPSKGGSFLVLPSGAWSIEGRKIGSIYVRDAYKEHWEIIKHQGLVRKSQDVLLISGTCSAGKTVESLSFTSNSQLVSKKSSRYLFKK